MGGVTLALSPGPHIGQSLVTLVISDVEKFLKEDCVIIRADHGGLIFSH